MAGLTDQAATSSPLPGSPAAGERLATHDEAILASLQINQEQLAGRVRLLEKMLDTRATPLWKRWLFRLDGWSSWPTVDTAPAWRPWRKWWRS